MKIVMLVVLCFSLSIATVAFAQDPGTSQSSSQATQSSQSQGNQNQTSTGGQNMSGTVSHSGKSVTSDKDSKSYKVDNPETLKGKEDQHVALIVQVDPDNNVIHIIQVEPQQ
jgi:hypothetical protein